MEFVGSVALTVGVGNDSVVHKFVLVKKFVYAVLLESDFLLQIDTVLGYGKGTVALGKDASVCLPIRSVLSGWPCQENRVRNLSERTCGLTWVTQTCDFL